MFKRREEPVPSPESSPIQYRVTSILGEGTTWKGEITGQGGFRIEGLFEGKIDLDGMIIVDQKGRVESELIKAESVIVAGSIRSDIKAKRVEIRKTGKVWGNVSTVRFSTEEGAYLRGKIQMEDEPEEDVDTEEGAVPVAEDKEPQTPVLKPKKNAGKAK